MARPSSTTATLTVLACLSLAACSGDRDDAADRPSPTGSAMPRPTLSPSPTPAPIPSTSPSTTATAPRPADPDRVRAGTAMVAVRQLAGRVGPRPGTSPAYRRAAAWVRERLVALGWEVERQPFRTPGGTSWGVPVPAGRSVNLLATRGDLRSGRPWLAVGAHLDTVPQAPGAEDNASGVGVLLAVAEAVAGARTRLPVALVAFGSEEPRGPGDDDHHYGSRAFVDALTRVEGRSLAGMVSLDRVGVGGVLPVSSARGPDRLRAELLEAARHARVPTAPGTENRASDHWSFVRAGLPGVRLGSTPYAGYHSAEDLPRVVEPAQLERAARTVVAWLAPR